MNDYEREREHDSFYGPATPADACREYAWNAGGDRPDRPWILTDYDVWMPNPHFVGDRGPHPEDYFPEDIDDSIEDSNVPELPF